MKNLFLGLTFLFTLFIGTTDVKEDATAEVKVCENWIYVDLTNVDGCEVSNNFWLCGDGLTQEEITYNAIYFSTDRC